MAIFVQRLIRDQDTVINEKIHNIQSYQTATSYTEMRPRRTGILHIHPVLVKLQSRRSHFT